MSYNHWAGMGRLVRDPEVRYAAESGMCIARYTLAIDRRSKGGENKTDFIRCVAFGKGGEFAEKYLHKGMRMLVSGSIQTDSYTDKDGKKVSTWEVVVASQDFADSKGDNAGSAPATAQPQKSSENWMGIPADADDEGLPFN